MATSGGKKGECITLILSSLQRSTSSWQLTALLVLSLKVLESIHSIFGQAVSKQTYAFLLARVQVLQHMAHIVDVYSTMLLSCSDFSLDLAHVFSIDAMDLVQRAEVRQQMAPCAAGEAG